MPFSDDRAIGLVHTLATGAARLARKLNNASPWGKARALASAAASGDHISLARLLAKRSARRAFRNFRPFGVFPNPIATQSHALALAAELGHAECLEMLSRFPVLPEQLSRARQLAAARGDLRSLRSLFSPALSCHSSAETLPASHHLDALVIAAMMGHAPCVCFILSAADPTPWQISVALALAVANQEIECVTLLLPYCDDSAREYASMAALKKGHQREAEAIRAFLLADRELHELSQHLRSDALHSDQPPAKSRL